MFASNGHVSFAHLFSVVLVFVDDRRWQSSENAANSIFVEVSSDVLPLERREVLRTGTALEQLHHGDADLLDLSSDEEGAVISSLGVLLEDRLQIAAV